MNKIQKEVFVKSLTERLDKVQTLIVTDFSGLKVKEITDLRRQLKDKGFEYLVVKNTFLKRVSSNNRQALAILFEKLNGSNGLGFSYDDPIELAKILVNFSKINSKLAIKAGILSDKLMNFDQIINLAKLPNYNQLCSIFLNTLQGIPRSLVTILVAVQRSLLILFKAIQTKKASESTC